MDENSARSRSIEIPPEYYEIRIQGILDPVWSEWLQCKDVTHIENETTLSCVFQDQTALHGFLARIRDMNLKLISVTRVEVEDDENEVKSHEDKNQRDCSDSSDRASY
jgi:hypothetical protein